MITALSLLTQKLATRLDMGENDRELISTLKATAFRNDKGEVSDAQMTALMVVANQYGLNPWTKEIYAFPDKKNGIIPVVGVDGWARIVNGNAQMDGMEFRQSDTMVRMEGAKCDAPEWMECIIHRKDRAHPTVIREYLDEVYRAPFKGQYGDVVGPWQTHPKRFLRHKAMIQCSRIALGYVGIYDQDEAERIVEKDMDAADIVQPASRTEAVKAALGAGKPAGPTLADICAEMDAAQTGPDLLSALKKAENMDASSRAAAKEHFAEVKVRKAAEEKASAEEDAPGAPNLSDALLAIKSGDMDMAADIARSLPEDQARQIDAAILAA